MPHARCHTHSQDMDLDMAKRMAKLTSAAYCSDAAVIQAWNCTRCLRVSKFSVYEVGLIALSSLNAA